MAKSRLKIATHVFSKHSGNNQLLKPVDFAASKPVLSAGLNPRLQFFFFFSLKRDCRAGCAEATVLTVLCHAAPNSRFQTRPSWLNTSLPFFLLCFSRFWAKASPFHSLSQCFLFLWSGIPCTDEERKKPNRYLASVPPPQACPRGLGASKSDNWTASQIRTNVVNLNSGIYKYKMLSQNCRM